MRRLLGLGATALGGFGVLASAAAIGLGWWAAARVADRTALATALLDHGLSEADAGLERVEGRLAAVRAIRPDVGVVHAQQADREGNVQLWGITGVQKEVVLASTRSLVTVEEVVDELEPRPGGVIIPGWVVDAIAVARRGAHPSYAQGYYDRDNDFYVAWDGISRDRDRFTAWVDEHVLRAAAVA